MTFCRSLDTLTDASGSIMLLQVGFFGPAVRKSMSSPFVVLGKSWLSRPLRRFSHPWFMSSTLKVATRKVEKEPNAIEGVK